MIRGREYMNAEEHALNIQEKRFKAGKFGVAKAVVRYMKRNNCFALKNTMDINWERPK